MIEKEFIDAIELATKEERIKWEAVDPASFNPPCSFRAEIFVSGKRYALNVHDNILKVYDGVGLVVETKADFSKAASVIKTECDKRKPEKIFDLIIDATKAEQELPITDIKEN